MIIDERQLAINRVGFYEKQILRKPHPLYSVWHTHTAEGWAGARYNTFWDVDTDADSHTHSWISASGEIKVTDFPLHSTATHKPSLNHSDRLTLTRENCGIRNRISHLKKHHTAGRTSWWSIEMSCHCTDCGFLQLSHCHTRRTGPCGMCLRKSPAASITAML